MFNQSGRGKTNNVCCTVGTCEFHGAGNHCRANSIKVGTEYALDKTETFCSTYKHKQEM